LFCFVFFLFPSARAHTYIHLTFLQISSMSLNSNFYDFRVKFFKSWRLFIPNFTRAISKITGLLAGTFSFVKFTSTKILFVFLCLFIYLFLSFNTRTKHFISDSQIYHHSYNLIYLFPSFFIILTSININDITQGFTPDPSTWVWHGYHAQGFWVLLGCHTHDAWVWRGSRPKTLGSVLGSNIVVRLTLLESSKELSECLKINSCGYV